MNPSIPNVKIQILFCCPYTLPIELEVIIDYGFAFVTYGNEIESKGVQFPRRDAPDIINRGGLSAVARHSSKISAIVPQEHQFRMRSDERDW